MTRSELQELYDKIVALDVDDDHWVKYWYKHAKKINWYIEYQQDYQRSLV